MTRVILLILFFLNYHFVTAQNKEVLYLFPGQGSDRRIFDSLDIDPRFDLKVIEYDFPHEGMSLKSLAKLLSQQIDTSENYYFVGVSLGGMLCVELSEMMNPKKTIIVSSAKNRMELPARYRFQQKVPLYKIFPGKVLLRSAKILQPIVEPDRNKNKEVFKDMLAKKSPEYMRQTVAMIINWERTKNTKEIYHIHGSNDHTIPLRNTRGVTAVLDNGSHMMSLTRGKELSAIINTILNL